MNKTQAAPRTIDPETLRSHLEQALGIAIDQMRDQPDRENLAAFGTALGLLSAMMVAKLIDTGEYTRRCAALNAEFAKEPATLTEQPPAIPLVPFETRAAEAEPAVLGELHGAERRIAKIYTDLLVEKTDGRQPGARRLFAILESLRSLQKLYPPITPRTNA